MKQTRRFLALLLALCLSWTQISPALAVALDEEQTEPVVVVEETVAPEVVETEAVAEEAEVVETEAVTEAPEVVETEAVEEEVVAEEAADFVAEDSMPIGSMMNPDMLNSIDAFEKTFEEYLDGGYIFGYEVMADCTVTLTASAAEGVNYDVLLTVYDDFENSDRMSDGEDNSVSVDVKTGQIIGIQILVSEDSIPATVKLTGEITEPAPGSTAENPIQLYPNLWTWNEAQTEGTYTVAIPAGATYYISIYNGNGMELTIDDGEPQLLSAQFPMAPVSIEITNDTDADKDYVLTLAHPLGTMSNPELLYYTRYIACNLAEGDQDGYFYKYIASEPGTVVFTGEVIEGVDYNVIVTNNNTSVQNWMSDSEDNTVSMDVSAGDELIIQIVVNADANMNIPAANVVLYGSFVYPAGHMMNPEVLEDMYGGYVELAAGDTDGYFYTYTATEAGYLNLGLSYVSEGVEADISVTNQMTYAQRSLMYDGSNGVLSIPVTEGDVLQINVTTLPDADWNYPAAEIGWTGSVTEDLPGTENNPYDISALMVWNDAYTEAAGTVTVAAGTTAYFGISVMTTMVLTINGEDIIILESAGRGMPAIFTITNEAEEAAEYALVLTYPLGSRENPDELLLADEFDPDIVNVATLSEGNWNGYSYAWTAPEKGELTVTMHKGMAGWNYSIANLTTYASTDMHASADEELVYSETIAVNAGDEILVTVNTCGAELYDVTPAGDVYFTAEYVMATGIEANPLIPEWNWNETETEATATFIAPVGTTYYGIQMAGMLMTVNGGEPIAVNGSRWMPEVHTFENTTEEPVEVTLHIYYEEGTSSNPTVINEGTTTVELAEGSEGAYYAFIAPDRGTVTFTINTETGWQYFVNNTTSYIYGDTHWCDDDPIVTTETVSVNKGDKLVICINTYDPMNPFAPPAGTVSFDMAFAAGEGTESNPIWLYDLSDWLNEPIPANSTVYFSAYGIGGMFIDLYSEGALELELNGEIFTAPENNWINTLIPASPMGPRFPVTFAITNVTNVDEMASFHLYHPYGSMGNPAQLNIGKNEAFVEENDTDGYVYHWFSEKDGYLTITMTGKVWSYTLNNHGSNIYGDNHSSTDDTVVKSQTIKVNAYDDIELIVNTPFSFDTYTSPAGTVKFTAAFASTQYNLLSGKSMTLKFTDPATGKAVAASKVTWEITSGAEFATLKGAKLTANKGITEASVVVVTATSGEDVNTFVVTIYPAVEEVKILDINGNDVTGQTLNIYANDEENFRHYLELYPVTTPDNAMRDIVWKASNEKLIYPMGSIISPTWNEKTESYNTGKVTLTAVAADGSGKKASVKIIISNLVEFIEITDSKGNMVADLGSGKSVQLKANTNPDATNKKVTWEIVEGADYAKITASGKLTATKGLTAAQTVTVKATAQDAGKTEAYLNVTITPVANKVVVYTDYNVVDGKFDMNSYWPAFSLRAEVYAAGDAEGMPTASQSVTWKSSNAKIATVDPYSGEVFCNKPGTVTFTATANDGSNKKATVKVTIIKSISYIELQPEAIIAGGKSLTLKPAIYDADATNKKLTWTMTMADGSEVAKTVATLSKTGKLTTKKTTEIVNLVVTCTATDGSYASASCNVTIYPATTKVTIMHRGEAVKGTQTMTVGQEKIFYAEFLPETAAGQFSWKSSNEKIAQIEVNPDGSVTVIAVGEKTGTVTITATALDGTNKKATMKIKVTPAE